MFDKQYFIDWRSTESHLFLNNKLDQKQIAGLTLSALPKLASHAGSITLPPSSPTLPEGFIWLASSGSTGISNSTDLKGDQKRGSSLTLYALSKKAFLASAAAVNEHLRAQPQDVWLNVLPKFHVGGLSIFARAFLSKNRVVDLSEESWSANRFYGAALESSATLTSLVPTQVFDLVKLGKPAPPLLRAIVVGGAKLNDDLYLAARQLNYNLLPSYGMTECCSQIATAELVSLDVDAEFPKLKLLPHVKARINHAGHLELKSESLMRGKIIWDLQQKKLSPFFAQNIDDWFVSSDLVELELAGTPALPNTYATTSIQQDKVVYLRPAGRSDDQIKIAGERLSLLDLNQQFYQICEHQNFCLLAQPDERTENSIIAVFEQKDFHLAGEWVAKFNKTVLPIAKIKTAYYIESLPRTALGKMKVNDIRSVIF